MSNTTSTRRRRNNTAAPSPAETEITPTSPAVAEPAAVTTPELADEQDRLEVFAGPAAKSGKRTVSVMDRSQEVLRDCIVTDEAEARAGLVAKLHKLLPLTDEDSADLERRIVAAADEADATAEEMRSAGGTTDRRRTAGPNEILELMADVRLFRSPEGKGYGVVPAGNQRESLPLLGERFRSYVMKRYFETHGRPPTEQAIKDAIGVLNAQAVFSDVQEPVFIRYAEHAGRFYVDLVNPAGPYVEIRPDGWRVCQEVPVNFYRSPGMLPLPVPEEGGDLADLGDFLNVAEAERPLLSAFLLAAMLPKGPYPILMLQGEQGSAKTTAAKLIGRLIDPRHAGIRAECKNVPDLVLAASNCHLLQFDNLSRISPTMSDAFCRLSTGGGLSTRQLYSDGEEKMFEVQRPVVLNGIEDLASRSDLMDRMLHLTLPPISDARRRSTEAIDAEFAEAWPKFTGALYGAVAAMLRDGGRTTLPSPPRMADFAQRVVAAETGLGLRRGDFMAAYADNRESMHMIALEESPLAVPIEKLLAEGGDEWEGTATELRNQLYSLADPDDRRAGIWPRNAKALSGELRRIVKNLEQVGIQVKFEKSGGQRMIFIRKIRRRRANQVRRAG
ncbi:MAG: hypothetical protein QM775_09490 [Pirellulales bacterium]